MQPFSLPNLVLCDRRFLEMYPNVPPTLPFRFYFILFYSFIHVHRSDSASVFPYRVKKEKKVVHLVHERMKFGMQIFHFVESEIVEWNWKPACCVARKV